MLRLQLSHWFAIGSGLFFLAVSLGAFGAHALKDKLDAYSLDVFEKAVSYHFIHAGAILLVAIALKVELLSSQSGRYALLAFLSGTVIFSGSLYLLAITGVKWLGAITPIGGTLFLIGWGLCCYSALKTY